MGSARRPGRRNGLAGGARHRRVVERLFINKSGDRHRGIQAIAASRNGPDQTLAVARIQRPPQFADALHQRVVGDREIRPDRCEKLVLRDQTAAILNEIVQHGEGLWPQGDLAPLKQEAAAIQIEDVAVELQSPGRRPPRRLAVMGRHRPTRTIGERGSSRSLQARSTNPISENQPGSGAASYYPMNLLSGGSILRLDNLLQPARWRSVRDPAIDQPPHGGVDPSAMRGNARVTARFCDACARPPRLRLRRPWLRRR